MAYTINLTDGTIFAVVADGTINTASSVTLVGKNYAGYGEFLDENFIKMLENFSNGAAPAAPLSGQLWYDKTNSRLNVYRSTGWKVISGATASPTEPTGNIVGDLWWDTTNDQLKTWGGSASGNVWLIAGPVYTRSQGVTGAFPINMPDITSAVHVVTGLYAAGQLVGVVNTDAPFVPAVPYSTEFANVFTGTTMRGNATLSGNIINQGNVYISAASSSNVVIVTSTGINVASTVTTTTVSATGNVIGGNITTIGLVTAQGNVTGGNIITGGYITAVGNIDGGNLRTGGQASAGGNITGANIFTGGLISAVGAVSAASVSVTGNVSGALLNSTGSLNLNSRTDAGQSWTNTTWRKNITQSLANVIFWPKGATSTAKGIGVTSDENIYFIASTADDTSAAPTYPFAFNMSTGALTTTGPLSTTGNINAGNIFATGVVSAASTVTGSAFSGTSITVTGTVSCSSITKTGSNAVGNIGSMSNYFNQVFATATTALYADVAERFAADEVLEPGTVVELGGDKEITRATEDLSETVFGVISTKPAYTMNGGAGDNDTHPAVAMTGRVPVQVVGIIRKGDRLVSAGEGRARAAQPGEATAFNVIGRALTDKTIDGLGVVEAIVTIK